MKKLLSIIVSLIFVLMSTVVCASGPKDPETVPNVDLKLTPNLTIKQDAKTIELFLSIGELTSISEETISAGFNATLEYNKEIFTDLTIESLNGWDVKNINNMVALVDGENLKANTQIAKLTFTLADNVEPTTEKITLKEIKFSDGTDTDNSRTPFSLESTIIIEEKTPEEIVDPSKNGEGDSTKDPASETTPGAQTTKTSEKTETKQVTQKKAENDKTKAPTILPKTGVGKIALVVVIIAIIGIISFIRYKKIQIK